MSLIMARNRRLALALATTVFFTVWIKLSNSWSLFCNLAKINGRRPSQKYLSIVDLIGASTGLYANKINCRCSKCAVYSNTNFCWYWETRLNWLKMLLAKARLSSRFVWKKFLNFPHVIKSSASERRFY